MIAVSSRIRLSVLAAALSVLAIPVASAGLLEGTFRVEGTFRAPGYDYSWLTEDRYQRELVSRTDDIAEAENSVQTAEIALQAARADLDDARNEVSRVWSQYLVAYGSGDTDTAVEAWKAVGLALDAFSTARDTERAKAAMLQDERKTHTYKRFWKARLENNWREAQAARDIAGAYTVAEDIARCRPGGGRTCSASGLLRTDTRFTVFQPVLGMVGVHHAHAKGLTGAGLSKTKFRGRHRVDASFTLALAAYQPRPTTQTAGGGANMTGDAGTPLTAKWQIIELDEAQGIGPVEIEDGFTLRHEISFHFGDESEFKARQ